MNLHDEIARIAYTLYENSGRISGRDFDNWLDAERIALIRNASQDIEEPEGEEPIITEETRIEEVEGTTQMHAAHNIEEDITVIDDMEIRRQATGKEEDFAMMEKKFTPQKPPAAKGKKSSPKKTGQKSIGKSI